MGGSAAWLRESAWIWHKAPCTLAMKNLRSMSGILRSDGLIHLCATGVKIWGLLCRTICRNLYGFWLSYEIKYFINYAQTFPKCTRGHICHRFWRSHLTWLAFRKSTAGVQLPFKCDQTLNQTAVCADARTLLCLISKPTYRWNALWDQMKNMDNHSKKKCKIMNDKANAYFFPIIITATILNRCAFYIKNSNRGK